MSRYIRLDDAIATIAGQMSYEIEAETGNETDCVDLAEELLNDIPSIDIVFCENCRECVEKGVGVDCPSGYGYLYCTRKKSVVDEDDYCKWGVRK